MNRHDDVVRRLAVAGRAGDRAALRAVLAPGVAVVCDGGGIVPVHGARDAAHLVAGLLGGRPDTDLTLESVNGRAGLAVRTAGRAVAVVAVRTAGARVTDLWVVLNPAKLRRWDRGDGR